MFGMSALRKSRILNSKPTIKSLEQKNSCVFVVIVVVFNISLLSRLEHKQLIPCVFAWSNSVVS